MVESAAGMANACSVKVDSLNMQKGGLNVLGIRWESALLQACCAAAAGYIATPLIQCSNKSSLPGLSVAEIIASTRKRKLTSSWKESL